MINHENLVEQIRQEFPELQFNDAKFVNKGDDHAVLILDNQWVFRFPRSAEYKASFKQELTLLSQLNERTNIPVPIYEFLSEAKDFGCYKMLEGRELTVERFNSLENGEQQLIVRQLGEFLSILHALPPSLLTSISGDEEWDSEHLWRYTKRYEQERRSVIAEYVSESKLSLMDSFYPRFQEMKSEVKRVTHGDLTDDHVFVGDKGQGVTGIIDFGDAVVGDTATDFSFFWLYGRWVPELMYEHYGFRDDPAILDRSQWYFTRFLIDRIFYTIRDGKIDELPALTAALETQLNHLPALPSDTEKASTVR